MKIFLAAAAIALTAAGPVTAQNSYEQLEKIAAMPKDIDLFLFQVATRKCWKIEYEETVGNALRFDIVRHADDLVVDKRNGAAAIPWRWRIEKRVLSSAEQVVNRCLRPEVTRGYSAGKVSRLDSGVPYLWTFKSKRSACARMAVYTNCRTECRLNIPQGAEIYGIALTKAVAEEMSGATCQE